MGAGSGAEGELVPDEELERFYPQRICVVEVTLTDGTHLTERVEAVRGTTGNPMPRDEVIAKCQDLMAPFLGGCEIQAPDRRCLRPRAIQGHSRAPTVAATGLKKAQPDFTLLDELQAVGVALARGRVD
jgi:2-methylcitrate dehydratase MmgE/PrpD-like protein